MKKILSALIIFTLLTTLFAKPMVAKAGPWYAQDPLQWYLKVYTGSDTEIFGERYTAAQVQWIMYSIPAVTIHTILGTSLVSCMVEFLGAGGQGGITACAGKIVQNNEPANIAQTTDYKFTLNEYFATNSISGIGYVYNKASKVVPSTFAQETGFGFTALSGGVIQELWRASRNVAYSMFVLAAIILSFMIIFRVKSSPQTVVSIQSALPKIFLTLIFVTFSYAIAGLLIDLMYVVLGLIISVFRIAQINGDSLLSTPWDEAFKILTTGKIGLGFLEIMISYIFTILLSMVGAFIEMISTQKLDGILAAAVLAALVIAIVLIFQFFILVALGIMLLFYFIRITWFLLRAYVVIILNIIFAPLYLTLGIFMPSLSFSNWVKGLIAQLSVFPIAALMVLLSFLFAAIPSAGIFDILGVANVSILNFNTGDMGNSWTPPLTTGEGVTALLYVAASVMMFMLIPKSGEIVRSFLSGKPFGGYGQAVSQPIQQAFALGAGNSIANQAKEYDAQLNAHLTGQTDPATGLTVARPGRGAQMRSKYAQVVGKQFGFWK